MSGETEKAMGTGSCWVSRKEFLGDAVYDLIPDCDAEGHTHDEGAWGDWGSPGAVCRFHWVHAACSLDEGHSGEHVFVSPDQIVLAFPSPVPGQGAEARGGG